MSHMRARLSAMMFLQYAAPGLVLPIISHYLKNFLGFEPYQTGLIMAMPAAAAIIAPLLTVYVADRYLSSERLLGLCHTAAGLMLLVVSAQTEYLPFLFAYTAWGLFFAPTFALSNAVAFHHVENPGRDFGPIRMWGPLSWVVAAWSFSYLWLGATAVSGAADRLPHAFYFASAASLGLGAYALSLPATPVATTQRLSLNAWVQSLRMFARPSLLVLVIATFFNSAIHQFYYFGMGPFLSQTGFADRNIMPAMSLGQVGEAVTLALLGLCVARLGVKRTLIIGVLAQAGRCLAYATGWVPLVVAVIPSHGICYAFFFTVGFIYVDRHSTRAERAGAQQLYNMVIAGLGVLAGNVVAGQVAQYASDPETGLIHFPTFWLTSAGIAVGIALMLALLFREEAPVAETPAAG